jgi:preprotein translocase subunit SecA
MIGGFAKAIFGSANDRYVRSLQKIVDRINGFEHTISAMTDEELRQQTQIFRQRLATARRSTTIFPKPSPPFARPRRRTLGQRHYDVQMVGGIVLIAARSPRCAPARARPWSRLSPAI